MRHVRRDRRQKVQTTKGIFPKRDYAVLHELAALLFEDRAPRVPLAGVRVPAITELTRSVHRPQARRRGVRRNIPCPQSPRPNRIKICKSKSGDRHVANAAIGGAGRRGQRQRSGCVPRCPTIQRREERRVLEQLDQSDVIAPLLRRKAAVETWVRDPALDGQLPELQERCCRIEPFVTDHHGRRPEAIHLAMRRGQDPTLGDQAARASDLAVRVHETDEERELPDIHGFASGDLGRTWIEIFCGRGHDSEEAGNQRDDPHEGRDVVRSIHVVS